VDGETLLIVIGALVSLLVYALAGVAEFGGRSGSRQALRAAQEDVRAGRRTTQMLIDAFREHLAQVGAVRVVAGASTMVLLDALFASVIGDYRRWLEAVVLAAVLLVAGIGVPRLVVTRASDGALESVGRLAGRIAALSEPLVRVADLGAAPLRALLGAERQATSGSEDEVRAAALMTRTTDENLQEAEQEMIDGVLRLEDLTASEVMVPRVDMTAASVDTSPRQILQMIITTGYSRIPIYGETIDDIVGVLYAKDLLPFVTRDWRGVHIRPLLRPAYFIPETKRLDLLLADMRREQLHIAICVDEYGGIAGLVSLEDIMEQIVGEIRDEYDEETDLVVASGEGEVIADGLTPITDIETEFDIDLTGEDEENVDTLGGWVLRELERLPREGDVFESGGLRAEVLRVERHRVRLVRLSKVAPPVEEGAADERGEPAE
jgi:putative hemolysin